MGQDNTKRFTHDLDRSPDTFRATDLRQILDDIDEELSGRGFCETIYFAPPDQIFIDKIIVWDVPAKNKKRVEQIFSYGASKAFITSIVSNVYNEEGTSIVSTVTETITRSGSKQFLSSNTTVVRT